MGTGTLVHSLGSMNLSPMITEQILYVILDSIVWLYGVAKIQQAGNDSKGAFPLMLCHVLYHPLITMSSYVGRFLREYPVPNP